MFLSRDLQWNYIAARRYDDAEAEYRRSLTLEGRPFSPAWAAFLRMLAHKDADLKALRELHRQLLQDIGDPDPPFFRDLGAVLHDRDAMLAILRKAAADPAYRGDGEIWLLADALGDADLAAATLRRFHGRQEGLQGRPHGFRELLRRCGLPPIPAFEAHPEFKKLLIETGLADYWRQTGKWGDGCKPVGADDFQCQ